MRDADAAECMELLLPLCNSVSERIDRYGMTQQSPYENEDQIEMPMDRESIGK